MDEFLRFVAELFEVSEGMLSFDTAYQSIPQWESLMQLRLVAEIEERYAVEIPIDVIPDLNTLRDFYRYVSGEAQ